MSNDRVCLGPDPKGLAENAGVRAKFKRYQPGGRNAREWV